MKVPALLAVVLLFSFVLEAQAQSVPDCCGGCGDTFCNRLEDVEKIPQLVQASSHLFYGMAVRAETLSCCDRFADVTFRVANRWKGPAVPEVTVRTGGGCAKPFPFAVGRNYLVSANGAGSKERPATLNDCFFSPLDEDHASRHISALATWQRGNQDVK